MKYSLAILLLAFVSATSVKGLPMSNVLAQASADQSLAKYLMQPRGITNAAANPAVSAACFAKYLPMLSEVASTFSTQYQACITLAEQRTTNLTDQAATSMADFKTDATAICDSFQTCDTETNVLSFFDCYSDAASKDVSIVYDISNSALAAANTLSVGLRTIQQDEAQCQNATEQTYVTDTAATYQLLDQCLAAGDVSTIAPVTVDLPIINNAAFVVEKIQCSNDAGTHTQTSADGSQTQSQTGPGCQSQSSGDGTSQGQIQSGNSTPTPSVQCSNGTGTHTQTSVNGTQTQSQTGPGCQSQSSGDGSSQSQNQSGNGTQSQCSGADCGEFKPFPPLFTMAPMEPMEPMAPMAPMEPFPPMHFN